MPLKSLPPAPISADAYLDMLKRAISANLAARIEHDRTRERAFKRRGASGELEMICAADLQAADPNWLYLDAIIGDPVREALRAQLKALGRRLFNLVGSTERMLDAAEEVANEKPGRRGDRIDIIDKTWDGIGREGDRWCC